jgi:sterol desaturase/sphingolipid hydroxylase (fatty acid hydroxylase superfamily)
VVVPFVVLGMALLMMGVERIRPGRVFPRVPGWLLRAVLFNAAQMAVIFALGVLWEPWLKTHRPWSADGLGVVGGAAVGYLVITFVYYWWHRWRHEVPFLWRWVHQLHHSPQRIEVLTSFYKHPIEHVANGLLSASILYLGVGIGPHAASLVVLVTGLAELFYHWNISTPRWLGYVFQRPESHCLHHESGVHASNYSDLPLWDMLFGTFRDPGRSWSRPCGFQGGGEERVLEMLQGKDVTP